MQAIFTFADEQYEPLREITAPTVERYAAWHGYEHIHATVPDDFPRPASWFRIPKLQELLATYDAVLTLGVDVIIVDGSEDIADHVEDWALLAMVRHDTPQGLVPSMDVTYMRPGVAPWLEQAWALERYVNHPWWEQAAMLHLMGYDLRRYPAVRVDESALYDATQFLPLEWHSHESMDRAENPRFAEATHGPLGWRVGVLRQYSERIAV